MNTPPIHYSSIAALIAAGVIGGVHAAGRDLAITDFAAAAPFTYNHETGGAYNDRTVGVYAEVTELPEVMRKRIEQAAERTLLSSSRA